MTVITFANFKGGSGKTTNSVMSAYSLAAQGKRVLLIDKDPQANATTLLVRTYTNIHGAEPNMSHFLMDGLVKGDLSDCIIRVNENLHFIPTTPAFSYYVDFLESRFPGTKKTKYESRIAYLNELIEPLKEEYDFIFIDVPPTISAYTDAALYASDFSLIVLQTQDYALDGAEVFVDYMTELIEKYDLSLEVIGVLCVIFNNRSQIDAKVIADAAELFGGENIFDTQVKHMERLKRYVAEGIQILDHHDKKVMDVYNSLTSEMMKRLEVLV